MNRYMEDQHAFEERLHPDDVYKVFKVMRSMSTPGMEFEYDYRYRMNNGRYKWFQNNVSTLAQEDGSVMVFSVIMDVTTEKEAEKRLEQRTKMYEAATDLADLIVWVYDIRNHRITMRQPPYLWTPSR